MLKQAEGSAAVAEAVALCRPEVVCAYPISPQTHIVEGLSDLVRAGTLEPCEYIMVESEFAALSVCIGARACSIWRRRSTTPPGWGCRS
jgi:pyruvate ferredoxin oxidoreductase alpha subunit